jgi:hypothetical protein
VKPNHHSRVLLASLKAVGVACATLLALAGVLFALELALAHGSSAPSPLPPPTDRRIIGVAALAALALAFLSARRYFRREADFNPWLLAPVVAVLLVASLFVAGSKSNERNYLSAASRYFPSASRAVLKADGHQACDWLRGRHWGPPPPPASPRRSERFWISLLRSKYPAPYPVKTQSGSTNGFFTIYARYLRRQGGGTLPPTDKLERQVTWLAWYKLCPFQRWAHTPVGPHSHSGSD